jgi:hypothetical protein
MSNLNTKNKNEIFSLLEEFPMSCFEEIKKFAKSLEIQGIQNEENILTDKDYILLRNKLLIESKKDDDSYQDGFSTEGISGLYDKINELTFIHSEKSKSKVSLREIQVKYALKELFIFEAISFLGIKDINGDEIDYGMNILNININKDDEQKVVTKVNELNANNANKYNPLVNNKKVETTNSVKSLTTVERVFEYKSISIFEELIKNDTLIFIDTSSLMNDDMPDIIDDIIPILKKYSKTVFIPDSVIYEISLKIKQDNEINQRKALSAKLILTKLVELDLYEIPESHSVNKYFADAELLTIFSDLRLKYNLCLITNDNSKCKNGGLSKCIKDLETSCCIKNIKEITVLYVKDKKLIKYQEDSDLKTKLHEKLPKRVIL